MAAARLTENRSPQRLTALIRRHKVHWFENGDGVSCDIADSLYAYRLYACQAGGLGQFRVAANGTTSTSSSKHSSVSPALANALRYGQALVVIIHGISSRCPSPVCWIVYQMGANLGIRQPELPLYQRLSASQHVSGLTRLGTRSSCNRFSNRSIPHRYGEIPITTIDGGAILTIGFKTFRLFAGFLPIGRPIENGFTTLGIEK